MQTKIVLGLLGLFLPVVTFALPPNVQGVRAEVVPEGVHVAWDPVEGAVAYRVYYGRESILARNGLFDDFEITNGPTTEITLKSIPASSTFFVSVLAVDTEGNESALFEKEAFLDISSLSSAEKIPAETVPAPQEGTDLPQQSPQATESTNADLQPPPSHQLLRALGASAVSSTEVAVTFTHSPHIADADLQNAFSIFSAEEVSLPISNIALQKDTAILTTEQQVPGGVYRLVARNVIHGITEDGNQINLEADEVSLLFMSATPILVQETQSAPSEVENLALRATPDSQGTYVLDARWEVLSPENVQGFLVAQSIDGGKIFGTPQQLQADARGVQIAGVPPSAFGLFIQTINPSGNTSVGISQFIDLQSQGVLPTRGTAFAQETRNQDALPSTGFGLPALFAMVGLVLGVRIVTQAHRHRRVLHA